MSTQEQSGQKQSGSGVQTQTVGASDDDIRLDKWFFQHFQGLGKGMLYKLIRKGQVRVDGKRVKPDTRVFEGNSIRVPPMPAEAYAPFKTKQHGMSEDEKQQARKILRDLTLFEDNDILVLNKPHGLATQGGTKIRKHIDGYIKAIESDTVKPKLVHRLDKETSGVLIIAKNGKAARNIGKSFKNRHIQKYYWAVVVPSPEMSDGVIEAHIAKGPARGGEYMMVNNEEGKYSRTEYVVAEKAFSKAAWVVFKPETGRTHQLRLHALLMGSPILGDQKYFLDDIYDDDQIEIDGIKSGDKLHLHAQRLVFPHPITGKKVDVEAPLPKHMAETFKFFNFDKRYRGYEEIL